MTRAAILDRRILTARAKTAAATWGDASILPVLRQATATTPNDVQCWRLLGLAQRNLDMHGEALMSFERAVTLAPRDPQLAHLLARTSLEAGLPATSLYARAHALAPFEAAVLLGRAAAQFAESEPHMAITGLREQLRAYPDWYQGHATVARLCWLANQRDRIGESFEEALTDRARDGLLWRDYAIAVLSSGDYSQVLQIVMRAKHALGVSRILDLIEAIARSEIGDIAGADDLFASHLPVTDGYLAHYVRHLLRLGRPDVAAAAMEGYVETDATRELLPLAALAWQQVGDRRWTDLMDNTDFVQVFDLGPEIAAIAGLADCLRSVHRASHQPLDQSVRGGTQTDGPLFSRLDPPIRALRDVVLAAVDRYVAALPTAVAGHPLLGERRTPLRFAGSWSVRLTKGGHHVDHVHPAGWISSALYIVIPDGAENDPDRAGWLALGDAPSLRHPFAPATTIAPKVGRLVLFPSFMWHRTLPFAAGERLTVAFDIARPPR